MNLAALKDWNADGSRDVIGAVRVGGVHTDVAVIGLNVKRGIVFGGGGTPGILERTHLGERSLVVGAGIIGALQAFVESRRSVALVGSLVGEFKLLAQRQSDDPRQDQFLLGKVVAGGDEL